MKLKSLYTLVLAALLTACTEDYKDWVQPQQNDQPEIITFGNGSVSAVGLIDFANIAESQTLVKVCNITAPTASSEDYKNTRYELHLENGAVCDVTDNGEVPVEFLLQVVEQEFGKAPVERELKGTVEQWISNGETSVKTATSGEFVITAKLTAPVIEEAYYFVGTSNNWNIADDTYMFNHSDQNVYDDPIFTVTVAAPYNDAGEREDNWFKIVPKSCFDAGSWDGLLGCEIDGDESLEGQLIVGGNALKMPASDGAKFYKISINMMEYSYKIETVSFDEYIYFIGATDGWSKAEQRLALTDSDNGVYTGFLYCADPNNWGNAFKFQREPGNWDTQINANDFTTYNGAAENLGDNIGVSGGESVYFFTVNMGAGEISAVEVEKMGIVGGFNGWGADAPDIEMTWNATAYCFEANIAEVTGEWKFRVNEDWAINLGGSLNNLEANGGNLSVTGTTVQLYPTRKTGETIFATIDGEVAQDPEPGDETFEPYAYLPGDANGWNHEADVLLGDGSGKYTGFAVLGGEWGWKVSQFPDWNHGDYGFGGEDGTLAKGGGNIMEGSVAAPYWVVVDLAALTYNLTEVTAMSLIGTVQGNWDTDVDMTWDAATKTWSVTADLAAGEFKIRMNHDWSISLGGDFDSMTTQNGANMQIAETGNYTITLYPSYDGASHCTVVKN